MSKFRLSKQKVYDSIFKAAEEENRELFRKLFLRLHERDQQEVFHLLYPEKKRKIPDFLSAKEFAEVFEWMDTDKQEEAVEYLPNAFIGEVFSRMSADDVAKFLTDSQMINKRHILQMMEEDAANDVKELLSYAPETAGAIMTKEFISIRYNQTVQDVMQLLRDIGNDADTIYYLYVIDEALRLVGVLSLRDLLLSPETEKVETIMFKQVVSAPIDLDQEKVADIIQDYDLLALPIIGFDGTMQGIVTFDDVMDVLEAEATEDFNEFAAIKRGKTDGAMTIMETARQRIPWIISLIFLSLLVGSLISVFEETLESIVILVAFIPMIMDTAGNVGTQSLAVAVRNINVEGEKKTSIGETIKTEFLAGLIMGLVSALFLSAMVLFLYQNLVLALTISVSILITISFSTVIGAVIPVLADKLSIDPAIASGPFIITINDAIGLLIYFTIATSLLEYL